MRERTNVRGLKSARQRSGRSGAVSIDTVAVPGAALEDELEAVPCTFCVQSTQSG